MVPARFLFLIPVFPLVAYCQKPVIFPGGVVNAASYVQGGSGSSIVSIFGANLSASTATASTVPLPVQLAGTTVTVAGIPAPLFYVSPGQINFQMPSRNSSASGPPGIVVSTAAGVSDPFLSDLPGRFGIFTLDGSGCGRGAVLNVKGDGTVSVNSPSNSVSPGEYITVFGTGLGLVYNPPPDGMPAPLSPLSLYAGGFDLLFDFNGDFSDYYLPFFWAGRAPGMVGVDQVDFYVGDTVREGCAVPLRVNTDGSSQPVTVSVRKGGGACVDPPSAGYGQITWEKTITTTPPGSTSETDSLTMSLQSSPGKQAPLVSVFEKGTGYPGREYLGPSCAIPGYRSLDAGGVSIQGPGFGPVQASMVPLQQGPPVVGLKMYQAALPGGSIQPGSFSVGTAGGADVGPFQSSVRVGSEIHVTTALAGRVFPMTKPITIEWTGGNADAVVTLRLVGHSDTQIDSYSYHAPVSDGTITISPVMGFLPITGGPVEIVLEVTPDLSQAPAFSAPGLSLGGQHLWKYTYRFEGILIQ
ncbi:MAG: hypothetical protein LAP87_10390 [Acidobacteriia bacterium]|nr:hypothetical protein [Terriglobia bacterium]